MLSRTLKIGVTGGIGSGKTVVCNIFQTLGIPVFNADDRAKDLMRNNLQVKSAILSTFGEKAYLDSGALNTVYMSKYVFKNVDKLRELNKIVHPAVGLDFELWAASHRSKPYVIREAALLVESGSYKLLDFMINVTAPIDLRIARVLSRDPHRSRQDVLDIISNQLSENDVTEKSTFVIENDDHSLVIPQVLRIHNNFIS